MGALKVACCAAAVVLLLAPFTRADEWNKKTILTFSSPVQIPGATLGAGTYVFKLADLDSNRHVVQVMDKDEKHVYGLILAIPDQRIEQTDDPVVLFAERAAGSPQAIRAWFYPGETIGNEFVYPKDQAVKIAKDTHQSVLAMEGTNASTTDEERMTAMRGATVGRVDESGNVANENNAEPVGTTGTTAAATPAEEQNRPAATTGTTASGATTTAESRREVTGSTAAEPSVGSTASQDARLKNSSGSAARDRSETAVGTSGQAAPSGARLPRTASNLTLYELLSGLALVAGLGVRRMRLATSK
jgi:hypothetical protein